MRLERKTVIVKDLEIRLVIGLHPHEQEGPQRLLVSVEAEVNPGNDERDDIAATLDYDHICDFIRAQAESGPVDLQETVARRILAFALSLPDVRSAKVETRKPDIFPDCDYVGIRLSGRDEAGKPSQD